MLMETQRLMIRDLNDAEEEMYHFMSVWRNPEIDSCMGNG